MNSEIYQMQRRMQMLKEKNKALLKISKFCKNIDNKKMPCVDKIDVHSSGLRLYSTKEEVAVVENCYRKSIELVNDHSRKKQRKKLHKYRCTNSKSYHNLPKKSIKSKNQNSAEIITLFDDDVYSNSLETSSQETTLIVGKRTAAKSVLCQGIQKKYHYEKLEDNDVVFLQTINPEKTVKDKKQKKVLDYETKYLNNKRKSIDVTSQEIFATKRRKNIYCERFEPQKNRKPLLNKAYDSLLVETGDIIINNNEDVIYLDTICQPLESIKTPNKHNIYSCNVKINSDSSSVDNIYDGLEILSAKSKPEKSHFEVVNFSKGSYSKQINVEQFNYETIPPIWDFTEEPVDFEIPYLHMHENLNHLSMNEIELLRSKGIEIIIGKWSEKELALLSRNYINFTTEYGVNDVCLLLGINRSKNEFKNVMKFWNAKHFLVKLGRDLNSRPLRNIYQKARSKFFPPNQRENCSAEEIPFLMELYKKYGSKWYVIAQKFRLSTLKCRSLILKHNKKCLVGRWTDEERKKLIYAIKKFTKMNNISDRIRKIPWDSISNLVPTRTSMQCSDEWRKNQAAIRKIWQETYLVD